MGNRSAALPPALTVGLTAGMPGRAPTGNGEVTVTGSVACAVGAVGADAAGGAVVEADGAVMETVADTVGAFVRCAAPPMTFKVTDVTLVAVTGTVS